MSDYVVKFSGQDNLSGTLNKVKQELDKTGDAGSKLDRITDKFEKIANSAAPLKKKLKDIQNTLAQMNMDGLSNTDIFHRMAAQAAEYQDAIGDARQATRLLSSDTANLDAGIQAFSAIAGAATIATGVMGMFGTENKEVQQAILKVQSALGILNGVQAIANTLNKDSILMLKIKQIQELATAQATTVNSTATGVNTIATGANTAVMKVWNTVKAIGKALLGDFSGLLIVGAGALATYAIATSNSADAEKEHQDQLNQSAKSVDNYTTTLSNTFAQLMTDYTRLKAEWKSLSSAHQKNQWIKDNENKLTDLGISVNNVNSVEEAFTKNTSVVVQGFIARAKAAAYLSKITDEYKKQIELIDKINTQTAKAAAEAASRPKVADGQEITDGTYRNSRYGSVGSDGKWRFSAKGADIYNTGKSDGNKYVEGLENQLKQSQNKIKGYTTQLTGELNKVPKVSKPSSGSKKTKKTKTNKHKKVIKAEPKFNKDANTLQGMQDNVTVLENKLKTLKVNSEEFKKTTKEIQLWKDKIDVVQKSFEKVEPPKFEKGSIADYENQLSKVDNDLKNLNLTEEERNAKLKERAALLDLIANKKEKPYQNGSISDLEEQISKLQNRLNNETLTAKARLELKTKVYDLQKQVDNLSDNTTIKIKNVSIGTQDKLDSFSNAQTNVDSIVKQRELGIIDKSQAETEIAAINEQLQQLGLEPIKIHIESDVEKKINEARDAIDSLGSSLSSIGSNLGIPELDVAGLMAQSVATMISGYATATSQAASLGPWAWIAFSALGAAQLAAIVGQVKSMGSFANGGIIGGGSTHGDMLTAQVNAGEMILNGKQQKKLFTVLDGSGSTGNSGEVTFKIEGSTLRGVLHNYDNKRNKIR